MKYMKIFYKNFFVFINVMNSKEWKEKGNKEFLKKNYQNALFFYNKVTLHINIF